MKVTLKKLDLMGYTPATQVWIVQNGGGKDSTRTFKFLEANRDRFIPLSGHYHGVRGIEGVREFQNFAAASGVDVVFAPTP